MCCADRLAYSFTEAALYDENCFTRSAAGGTHNELPDEVLKAVRRDCEAILAAANLSSEQVLKAYCRYEEIAEIAKTLPVWHSGECAESFRMFDGSLNRVAKWYRENGCGMFARYKAFIWRDGDIQPVLNYDTIDVDNFTGYELQRGKVLAYGKVDVRGEMGRMANVSLSEKLLHLVVKGSPLEQVRLSPMENNGERPQKKSVWKE